MRSIILALLIVAALGLAQAYPLQGGNDNVKCTLFEIYKTPGEKNGTTTLKLDVGLLGAENATYQLIDSKDQTYQPATYKNYQPGRQLLVFQIPEGTLFKLIKVSPTGGEPFNINWWKTPKGITGDVILRYYGVVNWLIEPELQAVSFDVTISNNGTSSIFISPENFTLLDQWGWPYYTTTGFAAGELEPKMAATHVKVSFVGISPFSRPSALVYDHQGPGQIAIDLDKDLEPLTDDVVYGTSAPSSVPSVVPSAVQTPVQEQTAPAVAAVPASQTGQNTEQKVLSLKEQINASKERLKGVNQDPSTGGNTSVGEKITSSIDEARQRLDAVRKGLKSGS